MITQAQAHLYAAALKANDTATIAMVNDEPSLVSDL